MNWFLAALVIVLIAVGFPLVHVLQEYDLVQSFWTLDLNEKGDFLAGVFSPLAFLAAVGALLVQSKELAQSRKEAAKSAKALHAQSSILEKREKGEEFEELLKAIDQAGQLDDVSWIFEDPAKIPNQLGRHLEVRLFYRPDEKDSFDERILKLGKHLDWIATDLEEKFANFHLPENPRVWSGYKPVLLLETANRLAELHSLLSPAKQQRFHNLNIQILRNALARLCENPEWWLG